MKKILFVFALMLTLAFGVTAQTTVQVNDTNAGYIEQYPAIANITEDTLITYDTVGDVVDTIETIVYDTTYIEGYYDYRAIANEGYQFAYWEVTTTYNKWYEYDTLNNLIEIDSVWQDINIQPNIEIDPDTYDTIYYEGWLEWDMGIPDLSVIDIDDITSIVITAYFFPNGPVGIERCETPSFKVYPNPTTGTINVLGDVHWITVYDMSGRVVASTDAPVISLQGWPNGTYLVRVIDTKGNMGVTKIIKR